MKRIVTCTVALLLLAAAPTAFGQTLPPELIRQFESEPSVDEAVDAALSHYHLEARDIDGVRRRATVSALLPEVDVAYRTNESQLDLDRYDYVTFPDEIAAEDLGAGSVTELQVRAGWDLGELVFNAGGLEAYDLVPLHREIAEEVIDAFYLRQRLMVALYVEPPTDQGALLMTQMRLDAATARLNHLTGGLFSAGY